MPNENDVASFIRLRGYKKVTVKAYAKSMRIHVETDAWSEVRNICVPISEIDWLWLSKKYPEVVGQSTKP